MAPLPCHEWLTLYYVGALDRHDRRKFEKHLQLCARCRTGLIVLSEVGASIEWEGGAVNGGAIDPPPAVRERILAAARTQPQASSGLPRPLARLRHWFGIVVGLALALFAVWSCSLWASLDRVRSAPSSHADAAISPTGVYGHGPLRLIRS